MIEPGGAVIMIGDVRLDLVRGELQRGERGVRITWMVCRLCEALIQAQGAPVTPQRLTQILWPAEPPIDGCLRQHMARLRRALAEIGGAEIVTRWHFGYEIVAVAEAAA